jgi:hypothetical protein
MSIENQPSKKKRNKPLIFALIGAGALAASVGGVFAANSITINSGGSIEFGQGLASTSTCDSGLTTAINQSYNASTAQFDATTVVVSGIKDFSCAGKTLHVSLVNGSGTVCSVDGTHTTGANQDSFTIADAGTIGTNDDTSKTVTITSGCDASTITKVAITTS